MTKIPTVTLNNDVEIPQIGFGVWQVPDSEAPSAVGYALEVGYRSIDTAAAYGNEEGVGQAIAVSGLPREELFVTTKLWNHDHGHDSALEAFEKSLARLRLEYVDLYLIHWPQPKADRYVETWKAFEEIYASGRARAIGVSNFNVPHLERLIAETSVVPMVNQVELHPYLQQENLRSFHASRRIATEDWSPLASGGAGLLDDPVITDLAKRHGRTPAQVILRWHVQIGSVVIPKSVTPSRIKENIDIFDFELSADDLAAIAGLDRGNRVGPDPDTFG